MTSAMTQHVLFLFAPVPEILFFAALDAASINICASALSVKLLILLYEIQGLFLFLAFVGLALRFLVFKA